MGSSSALQPARPPLLGFLPAGWPRRHNSGLACTSSHLLSPLYPLGTLPTSSAASARPSRGAQEHPSRYYCPSLKLSSGLNVSCGRQESWCSFTRHRRLSHGWAVLRSGKQLNKRLKSLTTLSVGGDVAQGTSTLLHEETLLSNTREVFAEGHSETQATRFQVHNSSI